MENENRCAICTACEHAFVSIKGRPGVWFRRAIERGDVAGALAAAHDLGQLKLADALALTCLLRTEPQFERAAVRWHSRFVGEVRVSVADASLALAALGAMPHSFRTGADALGAVCRAAGRDDLAAVLSRQSNP